jgi:hypothetical protein
VLGEEHPETTGSTYDLSFQYRNQGRYDEAEALCIRMLETKRRLLDEQHPYTLCSMINSKNVPDTLIPSLLRNDFLQELD